MILSTDLLLQQLWDTPLLIIVSLLTLLENTYRIYIHMFILNIHICII